jgi:hypothetical protein
LRLPNVAVPVVIFAPLIAAFPVPVSPAPFKREKLPFVSTRREVDVPDAVEVDISRAGPEDIEGSEIAN